MRNSRRKLKDTPLRFPLIRTTVTRSHLLIVLACTSVIFACTRPQPPPPTPPAPDTVEFREVAYDHLRPSKPPTVRVQVLIDASASMAGFKKVLPSLLHAVVEGLSYS